LRRVECALDPLTLTKLTCDALFVRANRRPWRAATMRLRCSILQQFDAIYKPRSVRLSVAKAPSPIEETMKRRTAARLLSGLLATGAASPAATFAETAQPVQTYVEAPGPLGPLKGTMLAPASGVAPVVLIIPGSGPTDRDGDNRYGVKARTYRLLAEGLVARGVATVRIDKRGMFASAAAVTDGNDVTIGDYASDVETWAASIRKQTGAPCIFVLGHSEGGLVALAAAQKASDICGLLLVAPPGRPLADILREQLKANPANAPILDQALAATADLERGKRVDTTKMNPALMPLFAPQVQGFLINVFSFDPAKLIAQVSTPVLILQGERDLQVSVADAERLKDAAPKAKLVLLPDVNHVLKTVSSDDRRLNAATYADPSLPLAPGVVDAIADFVTTAKAR
jgi:pimeloyl-ACP methyl ester carboxylesterase